MDDKITKLVREEYLDCIDGEVQRERLMTFFDIGANEHESHYVFDILFNNLTDIKPDTHATDTQVRTR